MGKRTWSGECLRLLHFVCRGCRHEPAMGQIRGRWPADCDSAQTRMLDIEISFGRNGIDRE